MPRHPHDSANTPTGPPSPVGKNSLRWLVLAAVGVAAVCLSACCGAGGLLLWRWGSQPAGDKAEVRSRTRSLEEELVKKYVLDHANDAKSVEFATWGPHSLKDELGFPSEEVGQQKAEQGFAALRLCWREKNRAGALERHDSIFFVRNSKVHHAFPNQDGDDWIPAAQERMVQMAEGMRAAKKLEDWKPTPHGRSGNPPPSR